MVFVRRLSKLHIDEISLQVEHSKSNKPLGENNYIGHQPHLAMHTLKSSLGVRCFVHLDHNQACDSQKHSQRVEYRVNICASDFVMLSGSGLDDQYALYEQ